MKPRLRGVWHQWSFVLAIPLGVGLVVAAESPRARLAGAVFAVSVAAMFGVSALYHRVTWSPKWRPWLRRLDHATIYALIAGTYTPFGLLVLDGAWRVAVLAVVWSGAAVAIAQKLVWPSAPKWIAAAFGISLGWVGIVAFPQILENAGITVSVLVLAGGVCYTVGAVVYATGKPDPVPAVFGYHEVFHALVVLAVALQYASVAIVVA